MIEKEISTNLPEETIELAQKIGANLKGGECIELVSDVGGGKTTFVRGLAQGAGSSSYVSSPTFTISKIYETPKFEIAHFDFYRLREAGMIDYEIEEVVHNGKTVIVVEWSEIVQHVLPKERITINIKPKDDKRVFRFSYPEKLAYLLESL